MNKIFSMLYYKMNSETIVMCVVALILGMLMFHMLKGVCGCKVVEGQTMCNCGEAATARKSFGTTSEQGCVNILYGPYNPNYPKQTGRRDVKLKCDKIYGRLEWTPDCEKMTSQHYKKDMGCQ